MTDTAWSRSREYRSYKFYRDFYEANKDIKQRTQPKFGSDATPLAYWDCDYFAQDGWGTRRIVKWVCIGRLE